MAYQNINQYVFNKWRIIERPIIQDFSLASDEKDYKEEVIFSRNIIAINDGNKLPFNFDLDDSNSSELFVLNYKDYNPDNNLISTNFYNSKDEDLTCLSSSTSCDIGLTGIDNGLVSDMTGQTITFTQGLLPDSQKFDRLSFDRRFKLHQVTGYTWSPNLQFSGLNENMLFEVVSKYNDKVGVYHELYGGFYQGFYKLFGYDYELFPNRVNKGWSVELLIKPRLVDEFVPNPDETTLNEIYPNNKNIFFYLGTRAENKFYHHADGSPESLPGYNRVTSGLTSLETCACCNTGVTNSRCIFVYPPRSEGDVHDPHNNYGCNVCGGTSDPFSEKPKCECNCEPVPTCGWECKQHGCRTKHFVKPEPEPSNCGTPCDTCQDCESESYGSVENTCESDPLFDGMSNAISFKLCGDPKNPGIGVRILRFTGGCETTGTTCQTGQTYTTGYTIDDYCTTKKIYDYCVVEGNPEFLEQEHWIQVNFVWERYYNLDDCDLFYRGGLGSITKIEYLDSLSNNSISLIKPPVTHGCSSSEQIEIVRLNRDWLDEKKYRMGRLKIYVNGRIFDVIENIEEIIPRGLDTDKEKQVGVPFNISWGGGTQGLHNHLTFTGIPESTSGLIYQQDPELFPTNILSGTTFSELKTNILLEQNFGGTFEGGISQFRMYTQPLSADEVKHNFLLLKNKFDLFDYDCPNCCLGDDFEFTLPTPITTTTTFNPTTTTTTFNPTTTTTTFNPTTTTTTFNPTTTTTTIFPTNTPTSTETPFPSQTPTNTNSVTPSITPTITLTQTNTPTITPTTTQLLSLCVTFISPQQIPGEPPTLPISLTSNPVGSYNGKPTYSYSNVYGNVLDLIVRWNGVNWVMVYENSNTEIFTCESLNNDPIGFWSPVSESLPFGVYYSSYNNCCNCVKIEYSFCSSYLGTYINCDGVLDNWIISEAGDCLSTTICASEPQSITYPDILSFGIPIITMQNGPCQGNPPICVGITPTPTPTI